MEVVGLEHLRGRKWRYEDISVVKGWGICGLVPRFMKIYRYTI